MSRDNITDFGVGGAACVGDPDCRFAAAAADAAVSKVFAILGVDVEDPAAVEEFRKDLRVAGSLRRAVDKSMLAAFVALMLFGFALAGASILEKLRIKGP